MTTHDPCPDCGRDLIPAPVGRFQLVCVCGYRTGDTLHEGETA